jgi:DNA-binding response OmpR family regulator
VKVLVVDDHPIVRQMAARLMNSLGHQAAQARDARDAEELAAQGGIELVLLDLRLGGTDGGTLAKRLLTAYPGMRILFMSGDGEEIFHGRELADPRTSFIEKPFSLRSLGAAVDALVARPLV